MNLLQIAICAKVRYERYDKQRPFCGGGWGGEMITQSTALWSVFNFKLLVVRLIKNDRWKEAYRLTECNWWWILCDLSRLSEADQWSGRVDNQLNKSLQSDFKFFVAPVDLINHTHYWWKQQTQLHATPLTYMLCVVLCSVCGMFWRINHVITSLCIIK